MRTLIAIAILLSPTVSSPALAYVGPGLGLGTIGALAGVLLSVVLAVVALCWYPLKRLIRGRRATGGKTENRN